ncbi:tlde1 domain-containing protein [Acidovorax sp. SUPP3334]|uniref:tlde1 domain-containing protein n=1 Tax=Acidovorax sp. SUPP3334 TaxID=2920881 RepID=UPI0023DE65FA|nr:tlde1 domain-containing protein [Acidovorax sp. SUPP3334]GKT22136.1 DUF2778 domain-containing protein [Acidovorax sp. SUPP3334]
MSDPYALERSRPHAPGCLQSKIALQFDGKVLRATGTQSVLALPAVSGKPKNGHFDYSAEWQKARNAGPIPEGDYWIQPSEMWANNWLKNLYRSPRVAWGNFRLTIHPYPGTETHGRGGFFIHGGANPGSAGCIDLTVHIDRFVEKLKSELGGLPECYIPLTVRYPPG